MTVESFKELRFFEKQPLEKIIGKEALKEVDDKKIEAYNNGFYLKRIVVDEVKTIHDIPDTIDGTENRGLPEYIHSIQNDYSKIW